jgi:hypothetical protein
MRHAESQCVRRREQCAVQKSVSARLARCGRLHRVWSMRHAKRHARCESQRAPRIDFRHSRCNVVKMAGRDRANARREMINAPDIDQQCAARLGLASCIDFWSTIAPRSCNKRCETRKGSCAMRISVDARRALIVVRLASRID